jgi:hypothetical protein
MGGDQSLDHFFCHLFSVGSSVDNIAMTDNKPAWSDHCEGCFACLQWSPQEAIQAGRFTLTMKRYHHPEVKIADMIRVKRKKPFDEKTNGRS